MVASVTPVLGFTETLSAPLGYWDTASGVPSPALGALVNGSDGHLYIFAEAAGAVPASGTAVLLVDDVYTFTAGAGTYETTAADIAIGDRTWLRSVNIPA